MSQESRPPEPDFVREWREMKQPKCCHTCDSYDSRGNCTYHVQRPPADFAACCDECPDWSAEIPF